MKKVLINKCFSKGSVLKIFPKEFGIQILEFGSGDSFFLCGVFRNDDVSVFTECNEVLLNLEKLGLGEKFFFFFAKFLVFLFVVLRLCLILRFFLVDRLENFWDLEWRRLDFERIYDLKSVVFVPNILFKLLNAELPLDRLFEFLFILVFLDLE